MDTITTGAGDSYEVKGFDAFGKPRAAWSDEILPGVVLSDTTNRGFTAHEHLDSQGLIHMNGRAYDPYLGRFLSVDPFIQFPENSQSLNPYSYILNNPLSGTDPTGYLSRSKHNERLSSWTGFGPSHFVNSDLALQHLAGFGLNVSSNEDSISTEPQKAEETKDRIGIVTIERVDKGESPNQDGSDETSGGSRLNPLKEPIDSTSKVPSDDASEQIEIAERNIKLALKAFRDLYEAGLIDASWIDDYDGGLDNSAFSFRYVHEKHSNKVAEIDIFEEGGFEGGTIFIGGADTFEITLNTIAHEIRHMEKRNMEQWKAGGRQAMIAQMSADIFAERVVDTWKQSGRTINE